MSVTFIPYKKTGMDIVEFTCDACKIIHTSKPTGFGIITERMLHETCDLIKNINWISVGDKNVNGHFHNIKDYCTDCKEGILCQNAKTQNR